MLCTCTSELKTRFPVLVSIQIKLIHSKIYFKEICHISTVYQSLQVTAIIRMFQAQVEEKVITEMCGHKSLKALRCHEHTSQQQQQNVSNIINATVKEEDDNSGSEKVSLGLLDRSGTCIFRDF